MTYTGILTLTLLEALSHLLHDLYRYSKTYLVRSVESRAS